MEVRALDDIALKYCYGIYTVSIWVSLSGTARMRHGQGTGLVASEVPKLAGPLYEVH